MSRNSVDNMFDWLDAMGELAGPSRGAGALGEHMAGEWISDELIEQAMEEAMEHALAMTANAGQEALVERVYDELSVDDLIDGMTITESAEITLGNDVEGIIEILAEADQLFARAAAGAQVKSTIFTLLL